MATRTVSTSGGNYNATGTWVEGIVPTASDDVIATSGSGTLTINVASACRSIDLTANATQHVTFSASAVLSIGTTTANGSFALKFPSGLVFTGAASAEFNFVSTVASTTLTVDFQGVTLGSCNVEFASGATTTHQLISALSNAAGSAGLALNTGKLDLNGQTVTCGAFTSNNSAVRTLTMGAANITCSFAGTAWATNTVTNLTVTANTATVNITGAAASFASGSINWNGLSVVLNGSGAQIYNCAGTVANLTRTGTAVKTDSFLIEASGTSTVGTLTLGGNTVQGVNRLLVQSASAGTSKTIAVTSVVINGDVDFQDIILTGSPSWTNSGSAYVGDCQGNTGLTVNTPVSQTWVGTASGSWSTNAWTTRVPLPQDEVSVASAFSAGRTITVDMPRIGKDINFTGTTGDPTVLLSPGGVNTGTMYGNMTWATGMINSTSDTWMFAGRGSQTLTTAGVALTAVQFDCPGGSYTLQDNLTSTTNTRQLALTTGTLNANNFNVNYGDVTIGGGTLNMGSGTWTMTLQTAATVWTGNSAATINAGTSTIAITNIAAVSQTFSGGGHTYYNLTYTTSDSSGALVFTGANTFNNLNIGAGNNVTFPSSTTTTISSLTAVGSSGNLITINSSTPGTAATLSCASGIISCNYLSLQDNTATGGAAFYAGANSTDVSNVTGWIFTNPPGGSPNLMMMGVG